MLKRALTLSIAATISLGWLGMAPANAAVIAAGPQASTLGYAGGNPSSAYTTAGVEVQFANLDTEAPHDVVRTTVVRKTGTNTWVCDSGCGPKTNSWCSSLEVTRNTCPAFRSELIGAGAVPVRGTAALASGVYAFHCSVHDGMKGNLQVL